jgi:hypothetical protein
VTYLNLGSGSSAKTEIVTPSAGANGAIGPNTAQTVISGSSVTFTATPNTGYVVNQWLLNGVVVQAGGTTYTLNDVTANAGVEVTFEAAYTVTPSAGGNGAINPSTAQTVTIGGGVTFTATPNAGYAVNQWLLNAGAVQTGGTTYTLNDVTSNDSVEVTFEAGYTVTPSAGANGAINPSTAQTVSSGGSVTFTATPAAGYVVNQWLVSGTLAQISGTSYTLSDVTGTDTVNVSFTAAPYPGTYYGLFAGGTNSISVTVSAGKKTKGKFTGKMYYGGVSHTLKGQFDSEGAATAGSPVAVSMQLGGGQDGTPGSYVVTGTVAGGGSATAYHTAYAKGKVIAEAGKTTVQLAPATSGTAGTSGTTGTTIPQGPGKATLTVSKTGTAHFAGKLPDGKAFSASATIVGGPLGDQCLIYSRINYPHATPAGTRGLLSGAITFPSGVVTGPLLWVKPEQTKGAYLGAINTSVSISP